MASGTRMGRLGLLLAVIVGGCSPLPPRETGPGSVEGMEPIVWPRPPAPSRIRFVGSVSTPEDLGIGPSLWGRVLQAVRGAEKTGLIRPTGVAVRGETLYVADPGAQALWLLNGDAERVQRISSANDEPLVSPVAVAVAADGGAYLADSYLARVFHYRADGKIENVIGTGILQRPAGLAYDPDADRLYVADSAAHCVWIFGGDGTPAGVIGERGGGSGQFNFPTHVAVDRSGNLLVNDALGFRVHTFAPDGRLTSAFGRHGDGSGEFSASKGIGVDSDGHVYVADALLDAVQIFDRDGQFLLSFGRRGTGPGDFWLPDDLYVDDRDRIYVADTYNHRIQIFQYLPVAGTDG